VCVRLVLRPRQDRNSLAVTGDSTRPQLFGRHGLLRPFLFRGSVARLSHSLSTLRRVGRPTATQDSLPAAGSALPDGIGYPQGSSERFQRWFLHLFLLPQASPGATKYSLYESGGINGPFTALFGILEKVGVPGRTVRTAPAKRSGAPTGHPTQRATSPPLSCVWTASFGAGATRVREVRRRRGSRSRVRPAGRYC